MGTSHELPTVDTSVHITLIFITALSPGDTSCGQRCLYELGMTGIPVYNVSCHYRVELVHVNKCSPKPNVYSCVHVRNMCM